MVLEAFTFTHLTILFGAYFLGGMSRGVIGFGLPIVAVPLLSLVFPVHFAMASVVFPSLVTGLVIFFRHGDPRVLLRRFQTLFMALLPMVLLTVGFLSMLDPAALFTVMGVVVIIFAVQGMTGGTLQLPGHLEKPLAPVVGAITGLSVGMTGIGGPVAVMYFHGLGLERPQLAQAVAGVVIAASLTLGLALASLELGSWRELMISAIAVIPSLAGTVAGGLVIDRIPPLLFRNTLLIVLVAVGLSLLSR